MAVLLKAGGRIPTKHLVPHSCLSSAPVTSPLVPFGSGLPLLALGVCLGGPLLAVTASELVPL